MRLMMVVRIKHRQYFMQHTLTKIVGNEKTVSCHSPSLQPAEICQLELKSLILSTDLHLIGLRSLKYQRIVKDINFKSNFVAWFSMCK